MDKMMEPEMTVVRFDENDVIATSGKKVNPDCTIEECTFECECDGPDQAW